MPSRLLAVPLLVLAAGAAAAPVAIAPGVHVLSTVTPPGTQPDGNSIVLEGDGALVVFDTGRHVEHTQQLVDFAKAEGAPIVAIVNSHWHLDHIGGNKLLRAAFPDVAVYASGALEDALDGFLARYRAQLAGAIAGDETPHDTKAAMRTEMALIDAGPALGPTDVVTASRTLAVAGLGLELHLERAAVTAGDVWVYEPRTRTLLAGDLVTLPAPFLDTACPARWQAVLGTLAATRFEKLVPGHGAPMTRASFDAWRTAFDGLLACGASEAPNAQCADRWLADAGGLVAEADHAYARALVDYYLDNVLRAGGAEVAQRCALGAGGGPGA
jgi:glyoxylase-like metal-dependent hydrolase (beta-lactamase superfamily II)